MMAQSQTFSTALWALSWVEYGAMVQAYLRFSAAQKNIIMWELFSEIEKEWNSERDRPGLKSWLLYFLAASSDFILQILFSWSVRWRS